MTCEDAIIYMPWLCETRHSMCRRASWHNYREPGLYMLTVVVKDRRPLLGSLETEPSPQIALTPLGKEIREKETPKINRVYPMVQLWYTCIMPDHIHMIWYVKSALPPKKHLGSIIGAFKGGCSRLWWRMTGNLPDHKGQYNSNNPLFEGNYHDRLISRRDQLEVWKKYLFDNPRRLAIKRNNPNLFTTLYKYRIEGREFNVYGNRFLLDIPEKMAVIVHRNDTDEEYYAKCRQWLDCGERGGVLVSAAVAKREKAVMRVAMKRGYCLILLRENGFPRIYKPSGEAFGACAEGRLLQISPWEYHFERSSITRVQCLELNEIAQAIANRVTITHSI